MYDRKASEVCNKFSLCDLERIIRQGNDFMTESIVAGSWR
jgi:hypothetical protein